VEEGVKEGLKRGPLGFPWWNVAVTLTTSRVSVTSKGAGVPSRHDWSSRSSSPSAPHHVHGVVQPQAF